MSTEYLGPEPMMVGRLVTMANQIAMNIPQRDQVVELTAAHLRAFWTPSMLADLQAHAASHGEDVSAEVQDALAMLRGASKGAQ